jgi:hypothetical protein
MTLDTSMLKAAEAALVEKKSLIDGIAANFKVDEAGNFDISKTEYKNYTDAVRDANEAKSFIDAVRSAGDLGAYLAGSDETSAAAQGAAMAAGGASEAKSLADVFIEGKQFQAAKSNGGFEDVTRLTASSRARASTRSRPARSPRRASARSSTSGSPSAPCARPGFATCSRSRPPRPPSFTGCARPGGSTTPSRSASGTPLTG